MSATDSDNSIDWLASDNEESELECDCTSKHVQTTEASPPPLAAGGPQRQDPSDITSHLHRHHHRSSELREGDSSWNEVSQVHGSLDCSERCGLYKTQQGERMNGRNTLRALKRPHGSTEEEEEKEHGGRQLNELERLFSRKCMELQCYIHPLSSILNGLRSGRYRERLSSFQESVAMDRIQRIMGVLQNPYMGEKYIDIILKMEEMLKSWFPNVKLQEQLAVTQTEEAVPIKKPKLSPVTCPAAASPATISEPLRVTDLTPPGAYSANHLKWLHTSPICSPTAEQAQAGPRPLLLSPRDLTQDNAVSSSTDNISSSSSGGGTSIVGGGGAKTDSVPRGPPPGKINAPCLERLLKSTDSIITRNRTGNLMDSSWS